MTVVIVAVIAWIALSFLIAMFVGSCIHFGMGSDDER
jgi:hypothetical protein